MGEDWDGLQTIFTFTVTRTIGEGTSRRANLAELRTLYDWLNRDVSTCLPGTATADERVASARCSGVGVA